MNTNILQARLKLSFARMLKADLDRGADFIGNFNCNRADGSIIVKGCSETLWRKNYEQALQEAQEYLDGEHGRVGETGSK